MGTYKNGFLSKSQKGLGKTPYISPELEVQDGDTVLAKLGMQVQ